MDKFVTSTPAGASKSAEKRQGDDQDDRGGASKKNKVGDDLETEGSQGSSGSVSVPTFPSLKDSSELGFYVLARKQGSSKKANQYRCRFCKKEFVGNLAKCRKHLMREAAQDSTTCITECPTAFTAMPRDVRDACIKEVNKLKASRIAKDRDITSGQSLDKSSHDVGKMVVSQGVSD